MKASPEAMPEAGVAPDVRPFTEVAAGIVHRPVPGATGHWEVLMGQRPQGKAYAGWWEFPGGKTEPGETISQALIRELHEELDIEVLASTPWVVREHSYPHARVRLHFHRIFDWRGAPRSMEAQAFAWQSLDRIQLNPLLPAALPLLEMLRWPARLGLHGFGAEPARPEGLSEALKRAKGLGLARVLLRLAGAHDRTPEAAPPAPPWSQLAPLLGQAGQEGIQVYLDESSAEALVRACPELPVAGFWRRSHLAGSRILEVWARGGLFSAASISDSDDLARSERPETSGEAWSVQASVLAPDQALPGHPDDLAARASAPLYWPEERLLTLGGHGWALAV